MWNVAGSFLLEQVFFAKVPRAATEADVMALFAGLGSVEDVVLFKASGAQHHKAREFLDG